MTEIKNEVLKAIVEQLRDTVAVSDEVLQYIENSEIDSRLGEMQTEFGYLLEAEASIEWYELANAACRKKEPHMWVHEIADSFRQGIPIQIVGEALDEAASVRKFRELTEQKMKAYRDEEKTTDANIHEESESHQQLNDTVAGSLPEDFEKDAMDIAGDYMDRQVEQPLPETESADALITLAMQSRDTLKGYAQRIRELENIVASQKQLLSKQRNTINRQEEKITEQKTVIEKYEKQLEQVSIQYKDMNQTLMKLGNIQTVLRMLEQGD